MRRGIVEGHAAKSAHSDAEIAIERYRGPHFGTPVGLAICPGGENHRAPGLYDGRIDPGKMREPFPTFFGEQGTDLWGIEVGGCVERELGGGDIQVGTSLESPAVENAGNVRKRQHWRAPFTRAKEIAG